MTRRCQSEAFEAALPRSMEGEGLSIVGMQEGRVIITDGVRSAPYVPMDGKPLEGALRIVPGYTEAGYFMQVMVIRLTDGALTALYVPEGIDGRVC